MHREIGLVPMLSAHTKKTIVFTQHMFGLGGIDRVACRLANGFVEAGFNVQMIVFCKDGPAERTLVASLNKGVEISYLGNQSSSRAWDLIRLFSKFVQLLRRCQPDCVISTSNNMSWITVAGTKFSGNRDVKLVLKITNPVIRTRDKGLYATFRKFGYRKAFGFADRILCLSRKETEVLREHFPASASKIDTVINPYVTENMLRPPNDHVSGGEGKLILGVGRFEPQKRFDLLIEAFAQVNDTTSRLVILGDGPDKSACENLVRRHNLQHRVQMPGFVDNVVGWFCASDIFVLTSIYEGLPAVVLEAMACNCPVLSTNCFPSAAELVGEAESCAIIDSEAPSSIAALIDKHAGMPRPTSLRALAETYTIENGVNNHIKLVSAVLSN